VVESLTKVDQTIVDTYAARVGDRSTREQIEEWIAAETWMTAEEAVSRGFADRAGALKGVEAHVAPGRFRNTPRQLLQPAHQPAGASPRLPGPTAPGLRVLPALAARIAEARRRHG